MCTGNIQNSQGLVPSRSVYPCVYREHSKAYPTEFDIMRFIPVCTGNIVKLLAIKQFCAVYPCVYREHEQEQYEQSAECGLSLCVQGTFNYCHIRKASGRFIPVCTGNIPIITYCFIIKILYVKFLPIFWDIFH